jgi:hypothetical protein
VIPLSFAGTAEKIGVSLVAEICAGVSFDTADSASPQ